MKRSSFCLTLLLPLLASPAAHAVDARICTDLGAIDVTLEDQRSPQHAANFLRYVQSGFYSGTVIHYVVSGSIVQGGRYDATFQRREGGNPVANESGNGLSNLRGSLAAARSEDPDSATTQFFFNLGDNSHLDGAPGSPGYTVFGRVTAGIEVLDSIASMPTSRVADLEAVPNPPVTIRSIAVLDRAPVFGVSIEPDPNELAANFVSAEGSGDALQIIAAADALKRSCLALSPGQRIAEAEAAIRLGRFDRARYGLEAFLAEAGGFGPEVNRARNLIAQLNGTPVPNVTAAAGQAPDPFGAAPIATQQNTTQPNVNQPVATQPNINQPVVTRTDPASGSAGANLAANNTGSGQRPIGRFTSGDGFEFPGTGFSALPEDDVLSRDVTELIGHCRRPAAPSVPSGRFAEPTVLNAIGNEVRRYRQLGELYLTCVSQRLDRGDLNPTEQAATIDRHNEMVVEMTGVSVRYNQAVRTYRESATSGF